MCVAEAEFSIRNQGRVNTILSRNLRPSFPQQTAVKPVRTKIKEERRRLPLPLD